MKPLESTHLNTSECDRILATTRLDAAQQQVVTLLLEQLERDVERTGASPATIEFLEQRADLYWRTLVSRSGRGFDPDALIKRLQERSS